MDPDNPVSRRHDRPCRDGYWQGLPPSRRRRSVDDMAAQNDPTSNDLKEFLTTRRAKISPEQSGLPVYGANRRVAGLRREEVALLAGISVEYYTRLERGSVGSVSEGVLDGLVHALQLDEAERDHLFRLVRAAASRRGRGAATARTRTRVRPAIQRILDQMPMPAYLRNGRFDVLAANDLGRALYSPLYEQAAAHTPGEPPNSARFVFLDARVRVLPRPRPGRERLRRVPSRRGRPRPLRQGPLQPRRRAVHPQRGLPTPLGRPRRPLPPHRPQTVPPPPRRRPRARLRGVRAGGRPRPTRQPLHRPTRLCFRAGAEPPGQLGRSRRGQESVAHRATHALMRPSDRWAGHWSREPPSLQ